MQISQKTKPRQQKLKLAAVDPQVRQVIALTRLDRLFEYTPGVDEAVD